MWKESWTAWQNSRALRDRYIKTIYNKANEMDLLINELTLYSKIDTNRIPYNFATISAKEYFEDCAEDLHMELEAKVFRSLTAMRCRTTAK